MCVNRGLFVHAGGESDQSPPGGPLEIWPRRPPPPAVPDGPAATPAAAKLGGTLCL